MVKGGNHSIQFYGVMSASSPRIVPFCPELLQLLSLAGDGVLLGLKAALKGGRFDRSAAGVLSPHITVLTCSFLLLALILSWRSWTSLSARWKASLARSSPVGSLSWAPSPSSSGATDRSLATKGAPRSSEAGRRQVSLARRCSRGLISECAAAIDVCEGNRKKNGGFGSDRHNVLCTLTKFDVLLGI